MIFLVSTALIIPYFFFYLQLRKSIAELQKTKSQNLVFDERIKNLSNDLTAQSHKLKTLEEDNNELRNFKGRYEHAQGEINGLYAEKERNLTQVNALNHKILEFEKQKELLQQSLQQLEKEKSEWQKNKENILLQLSEEMIKKNHEQHAKLTAASQENIAKTTENLFKNFESVMTKVQNLDEEVKKSSNLVNDTRNALLTPGHAGRSAEITLENILKASGLKEKSSLEGVGDYILQSHFANANEIETKRPDAILFLPNNYILIIDSKSSSHFLDLFAARANGEAANEKAILAKLKESMRRHVEGLKKRDYGKFFNEEMRLNNFSDYKIMNVMFLQTEQMLETVGEIDPQFFQKTMESGIHLATPIALIHLLNNAKFLIDRIKQQENIIELKHEVAKLLDNIFFVTRESREVGNNLKRGLKAYNEMSKRFNTKIIPVIKNIGELGISSKKSEEIRLLENYDIDVEEENIVAEIVE